jgi:hypothetical protein
MSKCKFGVDEIDYLGHFISDQGVRTDPSKLKVMSKWPIPTTIKFLRGFLGLTGDIIESLLEVGDCSSSYSFVVKKLF